MSRRWDYDLMRVCSMFSVVFLHVAAATLRSASGALWHAANLITTIATASVPLFFMLSGALLLSDPRTGELETLFRRRLPKVLIPLLAWSAVCIPCLYLLRGRPAAMWALKNILGMPVVIPYWFMYALLIIYLILPLLKRMTDALTENQWRYMLLLWLIGTLTLNTISGLGSETVKQIFRMNSVYNLNFVGGYLGFFLLGGWLERQRYCPPRAFLWAIVAADTALIAIGTWWLTAQTGVYDERFKSYVNLFTPILAAALFLLARSYGRGRHSGRLLTVLSCTSFGVYLAHPLGIEFWSRIWSQHTGGGITSVPQLLLYFLLVLVSCLIGVLAVASIKPLSYILTGQRYRTACDSGSMIALLRKKPD